MRLTAGAAMVLRRFMSRLRIAWSRHGCGSSVPKLADMERRLATEVAGFGRFAPVRDACGGGMLSRAAVDRPISRRMAHAGVHQLRRTKHRAYHDRRYPNSIHAPLAQHREPRDQHWARPAGGCRTSSTADREVAGVGSASPWVIDAVIYAALHIATFGVIHAATRWDTTDSSSGPTLCVSRISDTGPTSRISSAPYRHSDADPGDNRDGQA